MSKNDSVSRSWFCVFDNPQDHGYTGEPKEILERLRDEWVTEEHPRRTGAWVYCLSEKGLPHIHMVLEDVVPMRFSAIKKSYATGAHFEATKGTKAQVNNYIMKKPPFDEKGEKIIETVRVGEINGCDYGDDIYDTIDKYLAKGLTPLEILSLGIKFYKYESMIKKAYFAKRNKETPVTKDMLVYWHVGKAGTGKTYVYQRLCDEYGEQNIYFCSDYANGGTAAFDNYNGEYILFMDEFKGNIPYGMFLTITGPTKSDIHCRYSNTKNLWTEIHITSVFTPSEVYNFMVSHSNKKSDSYYQLARRINFIVYHYKIEEKYCEYQMPMENFIDIEDIHNLAIQKYLSDSLSKQSDNATMNDISESFGMKLVKSS